MKYLCLAFVIGWSGAAYAATGTSPPVTVPITIPSSGLTPPTEANAAGFTTLAANYDFSQPFYATQSNWLDCSGALTGTSVPGAIWHWGSPGFRPPLPCNINQATDPSTNQTVLKLGFPSSYNSTYGLTGNNNFVSMQTVTLGGDGQGGTVTFSVPNFYIESTYRIDATGSASNSSGPDGVWTWLAGGGPPAGLPFEFDIGEIYGNGSGYGDTGWVTCLWASTGLGYPCANNKPPAPPVPGWTVTGYHKYGALLTSDGSSSTIGCAFVDDVFQQCLNVNAADALRSWLIAWTGGSPGPTIDTNEYIQYIRVWSCPTWATTQCNGSTMVGSGPGTSLIYWH
jgi:hypothetical protein